MLDSFSPITKTPYYLSCCQWLFMWHEYFQKPGSSCTPSLLIPRGNSLGEILKHQLRSFRFIYKYCSVLFVFVIRKFLGCMCDIYLQTFLQLLFKSHIWHKFCNCSYIVDWVCCSFWANRCPSCSWHYVVIDRDHHFEHDEQLYAKGKRLLKYRN